MKNYNKLLLSIFTLFSPISSTLLFAGSEGLKTLLLSLKRGNLAQDPYVLEGIGKEAAKVKELSDFLTSKALKALNPRAGALYYFPKQGRKGFELRKKEGDSLSLFDPVLLRIDGENKDEYTTPIGFVSENVLIAHSVSEDGESSGFVVYKQNKNDDWKESFKINDVKTPKNIKDIKDVKASFDGSLIAYKDKSNEAVELLLDKENSFKKIVESLDATQFDLLYQIYDQFENNITPILNEVEVTIYKKFPLKIREVIDYIVVFK